MYWQSKRRCCFLQVDETYQPWHTRRSLPPCFHNLQPPKTHRTTKSAQDTMVIVPRKHLLPHPAGNYGKWTKRSTRRHYQANEGNSGFEEEKVWALGTLRSLRSKKKCSAEERYGTLFSSNKDRDKLIQHYVERETAVARKRVQDAETAVLL